MRYLVIFLIFISPSLFAKNIALLIGNGDYNDYHKRHNLLGYLPNTNEDITDMKKVLEDFNFQVRAIPNVNKTQFTKAIDRLIGQVNAGDRVLFYFSGHGSRAKKKDIYHNRGEERYYNYLLPIGANYASDTDIANHGIPAEWILGRLEKTEATIKLMILDACRNSVSLSKTKGFGDGGFTRMRPQGVLVAYATEAGHVSWADKAKRNSLYTEKLLTNMRSYANQSIHELLRKTSDAVWFATRDETEEHLSQIPWTEGRLHGDYCLGGCEQQGKKGTRIDRYIAYDDGTALDTVTGLTWMRCSLGQTWTGSTCAGVAKRFNWENAKQQTAHFAGFNDWRIPTIEELSSLVYCSNGKPDYFNQGKLGRKNYIGQGSPDNFDWGCEGEPDKDHNIPTIVQSVFPNTLSASMVWSDSSLEGSHYQAWYVTFGYGAKDSYLHYYEVDVRLVRGKQ